MRLDRLEVVLVSPETPANVGAAARACRNFGVSRLCVAGSAGILDDPAARATAHGCEDLLASVRRCRDLEEALAPHVAAVGTANRVRRAKLPPLLPPHEAIPALAEASGSGTCALVFGRESTGLTDVDLSRCNHLMRLPTEVEQPSLNLAQAVLLSLQECWRSARGWSPALPPLEVFPSVPEPVHPEAPSFAEYGLLLSSLERLMARSGFRPYAGDPESFRLAARRSLARGRFERRDLRTLLTALKSLERLAG